MALDLDPIDPRPDLDLLSSPAAVELGLSWMKTTVGRCRHFKERMNILLTESIVPLGHNESDTGRGSLGE